VVGKLRFQRLRVILIRKDGKRRVNYLHSAGDKSVWRYRDWWHRYDHGSVCCQCGGHKNRDGFDLAHCRECVAEDLQRGGFGKRDIHSRGHKRCQEIGCDVEL
jgi:hypothetical protein